MPQLKPWTEIVLADPPWMHTGDPNKMGAAGKEYDLLTIEQMATVDVASLCADQAVLFLWATCPRLDDAIWLLDKWGFNFAGVPFIWRKTTMAGNPINGQGVRPTLVKPTTELVISGIKRGRSRPFPILNEGMAQVIESPRPGKHSHKPQIFHDLIVELLGDRPRAELFARRETAGWNCTGIELDGIDFMDLEKQGAF